MPEELPSSPTTERLTEPPVLPEVSDDVSAIIREPILRDDEPVDAKAVRREWRVASEHMRRDILSYKEVRAALTPFAAQPLSEALPGKAVSATAHALPKTSESLQKLQRLEHVLALPSIPDEVIQPDVHYAPGLPDRSWQIRRLSKIKRELGEETYRERLGWLSGEGITSSERELILLRYRQARDTKLLALMAELIDEPGELSTMEDDLVERTLKSGVQLVMTAEAAASHPDVLDPAHWQKRKLIKDRVHAVTVNDTVYILKERKTARHYDTARNGHVEGLTSKEEFNAARHFANLGTIHEHGADFRWERPLGYVEYPDGFQFCLFACDPSLATTHQDKSHTVERLADAIIEREELYKDEFEEIRKLAKQLYAQQLPLSLISATKSGDTYAHPNAGILARAKAKLRGSEKPIGRSELTFKEFAFAKAVAQVYKSISTLSETIINEGYVNTDTDGYALGVLAKPDEKPALDIAMFDFERYYGIEEAERKWPGIVEHQRGTAREVYTVDNIIHWTHHTAESTYGNRGIQKAAMIALLRQSGVPEHPQKDMQSK